MVALGVAGGRTHRSDQVNFEEVVAASMLGPGGRGGTYTVIMTDGECLQAFSDIQAALGELDLDWVAQQVNALLAVGRVTQVQVSTISAAPGSPSDQMAFIAPEQVTRRGGRGGRKADFAKAVDYSPHDRLAILLDAIDQTFIQTAQMQLQAESAVKDMLSASGIELVGPTTATGITLVPDDARLRSTATLRDLVQALRSQLS